MHASFMRFLFAIPLGLSAAAANAEIDGHALYMKIAPQLAENREQLQADCAGGNPQSCEGLQNLDDVLGMFEQADAVCQAGDATACKDLGVGVGLLVVASRCRAARDANACAQVQHIRSLAPACNEGDVDACQQIEFALFGTEAPTPPEGPAQPPAEGME